MMHKSTPLLAAFTVFYSLAGGIAVAAPDHSAMLADELAVISDQTEDFLSAAQTMAAAARSHCNDGGDFKAAYAKARLAWAPLEAYQFGPMEQTAAALSVNFWPDKKGFVRRGLQELLSQPTDKQGQVEVIAARSAAIQGFPAIEALIDGDHACPALIGISTHIARKAGEFHDEWFAPDGWADMVMQAGPENPVYLSPREFTKEIYTALNYSVDRMVDYALKRPLGDASGPKPERAEAWQTGMSLAIVDAQLGGIAQMIDQGFGDGLSPDRRAEILQIIEQNRARVLAMDAPLTELVTTPTGTFEVEGLRGKIRYLKLELDQMVGADLGVETGFSPSDGD